MPAMPRQRRQRRQTDEAPATSGLRLLSQPKIKNDHHDDLAFEREEYTESNKSKDKNERIRKLVHQLLIELGDDPDREGLRRTPKRVDRALRFLTSGNQQSIKEILNDALFEEKYSEMVIVKDIDFYSLCEHHLLPFYGKCHVAYIPNGKVVGLSKIPRLVDMFARRLQLQERMTTQIAKAIMKALQPDGVAVVSEARHLCMMMRGVQKQNTVVTNSALLGIFHDDRACREEFMQLIGHRQMG
jgi:GTP cyclohydrolase I